MSVSTPSRLRLQKLYGLADGWLDGQGKAPPAEGLVWMEVTWSARWPAELAMPHAYPTESGGLNLEWSGPGHEAGLEVDLTTKRAELQIVGTEAAETVYVQSLDLTDSEHWDVLIESLRGIQVA